MNYNIDINVALVAVFAALIAVFALIPPLFVVAGVPFAIQLIIVLLAPLVLGPIQGALAALLYVFLGVVGLPVFAGQRSGVSVLLGGTGGYLVGFVFAGLVTGALGSFILARRDSQLGRVIGLTVAALAGVLVIHIGGIIGLMFAGNQGKGLAFRDALVGTLTFVPLDLIKAVAAALLATAVLRAFPRLQTLRR